MVTGQRSGAMGSSEVVSGNIEFYTLFTDINITRTGDFSDNTQKDFESVVQVIGLRAQPVVMNNPVALNGVGAQVLENYGAPTLTGAGWIFKFAVEHPDVFNENGNPLSKLISSMDGVVLNGGTLSTTGSVNIEFTQSETL